MIRGAARPLGDERDALARGAGQERVGAGHHLGRRAVVADQLDAGGRGEPLGELAQVARVGAGEGVDRLGRVADDAQLVAAAEPQVEQRVLERRDVLELVDDEPLVLPAHLRGDRLVVGEQAGTEEQHVLHVHPALVALDLLVGRERAGDHLRLEPGDRAARAPGRARRRCPGRRC